VAACYGRPFVVEDRRGAMKTYLGVDVGTTGVKASIFDVCGNLKSQGAARWAEGLKHIFAVPESAILNSGPSE
jgi:hypothetical protein